MSDILQIRDISKSFSSGRIRAVKGINLNIRRGAVTALIGPNGAGKTTLFNLISGYIQPDAGKGTIIYQPKWTRRRFNLTGLEPWRIAQLRVGRLFQDIHTFGSMTALDNVLSGFQQKAERNFLYTIFGRKMVEREELKNIKRAFELLELFGLKNEAYAQGGELSYGQQKLLAMARLMAADPELILLDEPTAGLGGSVIDKMRRIIVRLVKGKETRKEERRTTVVIIEHNLSFFAGLADWRCDMNEGVATRMEWSERSIHRPIISTDI